MGSLAYMRQVPADTYLLPGTAKLDLHPLNKLLPLFPLMISIS